MFTLISVNFDYENLHIKIFIYFIFLPKSNKTRVLSNQQIKSNIFLSEI